VLEGEVWQQNFEVVQFRGRSSVRQRLRRISRRSNGSKLTKWRTLYSRASLTRLVMTFFKSLAIASRFFCPLLFLCWSSSRAKFCRATSVIRDILMSSDWFDTNKELEKFTKFGLCSEPELSSLPQLFPLRRHRFLFTIKRWNTSAKTSKEKKRDRATEREEKRRTTYGFSF